MKAPSDAIQPIGFHIGLSRDWVVTALSANAGDHLGGSALAALGKPMTDLLPVGAIHDIRNRMALLRSDEAIEHLFHCQLAPNSHGFDLSIYCAGEGYALDGEACAGSGFGDATGIVEGMLARLDGCDTAETLCDAAARQIRSLTGYDNVCIHVRGTLLARSTRGGAQRSEPDIPQALGNLMVADRVAASVAILGTDGSPSATIRSDLRAPTPSELDWLDNAGGQAAMVLPLVSNGVTWGQICCIHSSPRHVSLERRSIARLFAAIVALRIENHELRAEVSRGA